MKKGFTLIELLLVITILSVLAVSVFVALNPSKRLKDAKDARRFTDVDSILTAIHASIVDDKGTMPSNMPAQSAGVYAMLGTGPTGCNIATTYCGTPSGTCVNLLAGTENLSTYIASIPVDPSGGSFTGAATGYGITRDANDIITIKACNTELNGGVAITVSR